MKIETQAKLIVNAGFVNSGKTTKQILLAIENKLNDEFGAFDLFRRACSRVTIGFRIHIQPICGERNKKKILLITKKDLADVTVIYSCPNCDETVLKAGDNFCSCCGIEVRWSKSIIK